MTHAGASDAEGPGGTSGAGLADPEAPSCKRRFNGTSGMTGILNGLRVQGGESTTATDAVNPGVKDKKRANRNADDEDFTRLPCSRNSPLEAATR
ncbi:hypothetical protein NDU88_005590 [Pleurodeles waltl]|uniref:Uncharacterized protein n=1 Tax=Pleurodeles waltl TaxID=8319 RepID=A0AAV7TXK1_PLEWA|nr:hypothetical protein NDU88_005590 [Pleurodeles waltl]